MLTRRIAFDTLRRLWAVYAMAGALLFAIGWIESWAPARDAPDVLAWALTASWVLAFLPATALDSRELTQLPVSRRQMWVVRWAVAVLVPATLVALVLFASSALPGSNLGIERVLTVALLCGLYGGCYMALTAVFPVIAGQPNVIFTVLVRVIGIFVGGAALPFWFAPYLPNLISSLGGPSTGLVLAATGLTAASYFNQPEIVERPSPPRLHSRVGSSSGKRHLLDLMPGSQLTGLPLLYWLHAREIVTVLPFAFLTLCLIEAISTTSSAGSVREFMHRLQLMPFDADYRSARPQGFNVLVFVFVGMGHKMREIMQRARALRVLPMTPAALSVAVAGQSVVTALIIWILLIGIHVAVAAGMPHVLRGDIFLVFTGGLVLYRAIELVFPSSFAGGLVGSMILVPPVIIATTMFTTTETGIAVAGAVSIVAGIAGQTWLLRRRSKIYQFKPPTLFGRPMPS